MKISRSCKSLMLLFVFSFLGELTSYAQQFAHHGQVVATRGDIMDCIGCHDGESGSHAQTCTTDCNFKTSHSVLKDYPPRGQEASYAPVETLAEKGIQLFNGKVTCISCHNLNNLERSHLATNNLCSDCHQEIQ